jgi:hypothetical protein
VRRNDRCPCGSGAKYKRCCLERLERLDREVSAVEARVGELGLTARARFPADYAQAFADFYVGGEDAFGVAGPDRLERLEADLWIVCDRSFGDDGTPLELALARVGRPPDPCLDRLARSQLRTWRIETVRGVGLLDASCPLTGQSARLETVQRPAGDPEPGRFVVARSVPRANGTYALLGRAPIVDPRAHDDFQELFKQLACEVPERERFWRECGGTLAAAAWNWPEEREHTREGDIVQSHFVSFKLPDTGAARRAFDAHDEFARTGEVFWDSAVVAWYWLGVTASAPVEMPEELGVEWFLCHEDAAERPQLAKLELRLDHDEVWLFAPSASRFERVEADFTHRFGPLLGEVDRRGVDWAEILPRWKREHIERVKEYVARRYGGRGQMLAA